MRCWWARREEIGMVLFLTCGTLRIDTCTSLLLDFTCTEIRKLLREGGHPWAVVGAWNFACISTHQRLIACWVAVILSLHLSRPGFFGAWNGRKRWVGSLK